MFYYHVPAAFIITFVMVLFIALYTRRRLKGLWLVFLAIFLISWSGQLWVRPFGPTWHGIIWMPLFIISFLTSILVLWLLPSTPASKIKNEPIPMNEVPLIGLGIFFWIAMILLMLSIVAGYLHISTPAIPQ
jgi:hypothetical protein